MNIKYYFCRQNITIMNALSHAYTAVVTVAAMLLAPVSVVAQTDTPQADTLQKANQLTVGLSFMGHGEVRGGGLPRPADKETVVEAHANFLLGRLRLSVGYKRKWLELQAVIQNKAVWGTKGNMALNLYEGYARMKAPCGLFGQLGRVALAYDDERIIGPNDFAMAALSHDVLRFGYEGHGHKAHAILAYNQNAENVNLGTYYISGAQPYKSMQTVWYHYDVPTFPLGASLLFMNIGLQAGQNGVDAHTEYQQVMGAYVNYHPKWLTLEGSYYRQIGQQVDNELAIGKIDAWMASVKATIKPNGHYGFELGYDYLSGDDYVSVPRPGGFGLVRHVVHKGFSPVYGSRTKFYGLMDYFYESAYINGFTPGLQNAFVGAFCKPVPKLFLGAAYHYLAVTTKLEKLDSTLGHDIELLASYRFSPDVSLTAGFSFMIGTETMDRLKQGDDDKHVSWGWFSLNISPTLFKTRW